MNRELLKSVIAESQHCQRSWDVTRSIPPEDVEVLKTAVTQCPSKQNRVFYKAIFITDPDSIAHIHETTQSFVLTYEPRTAVTNSQVLANCLVVFVRDRDYNEEGRTENEVSMGKVDGKNVVLNPGARVDEDRAVGLGVGYLVFTSHLMGYRTGIYNAQRNKDLLQNMFNNEVLIMVGVGYNDPDRNDREHQLDPSFTFPSLEKNVITEDGDIYTNGILCTDISNAT